MNLLPVRSHTNQFISLQVASTPIIWKNDDLLQCGDIGHSVNAKTTCNHNSNT